MQELVLPTETGEVSLYEQAMPAVIKLVVGDLQLRENGKVVKNFLISKGIALITPKGVQITVSALAQTSSGKMLELRSKLQMLELKLKKIKMFGSLEEVHRAI